MNITCRQQWAHTDNPEHVIEVKDHPNLNYVLVYDHQQQTEREVMRAHFGKRYRLIARPNEEPTP